MTTSPVSSWDLLVSEHKITIQSYFPNGLPSKIHLIYNLVIQNLYCRKATVMLLYPSGNIQLATLAGPRTCDQRIFLGTLHLLSSKRVPADTTVVCRDDPSNPIAGYWLSKTISIHGIPCLKGTPVLFDEEGYLAKATLAERLWLPGQPPLYARQEITLKKGAIILPPPSPDAEKLCESFFN